MKNFKISSQAWKIILMMFVVSMLMFFLVVFDRSDEKKAVIAERQELVGRSVQLRTGDTVKIYRYNVWHKKFILEDGMLATPEMISVMLIRN